MNEERQYFPSMTELVDRMSIDSIKMVLQQNQETTRLEIHKLLHDFDLLSKEKNLILSSRLICAVIIISQINLHIWKAKDQLKGAIGEHYDISLKYAHQLNGLRNRIKNFLLISLQDTEKNTQWTNDSIDGLDDWIGDLLGYETDNTR